MGAARPGSPPALVAGLVWCSSHLEAGCATIIRYVGYLIITGLYLDVSVLFTKIPGSKVCISRRQPQEQYPAPNNVLCDLIINLQVSPLV